MRLQSKPLLQVALDVLSTQRALEIAGQVHPYWDIIEIGTPLMIAEGLSALESIKTRFPDKKYLADLKIMDAGKIEASLAFARGADIVTVLAAADDLTIRGALEAAEACGGQLMADLINVRDPLARAIELCAMKVPIICLHTAFDRRDSSKDIFHLLDAIRPAVGCELAIAGGLTLGSAGKAAARGADIVVVGSGITEHGDPRAAAHGLMREIAEAAGRS